MKHMFPQQAWALIQSNSGALFIDVRMVVESPYGFEGEPDDNGHRSTECGWRYEGLPWTQS